MKTPSRITPDLSGLRDLAEKVQNVTGEPGWHINAADQVLAEKLIERSLVALKGIQENLHNFPKALEVKAPPRSPRSFDASRKLSKEVGRPWWLDKVVWDETNVIVSVKAGGTTAAANFLPEEVDGVPVVIKQID
jgi:hypothetical protein